MTLYILTNSYTGFGRTTWHTKGIYSSKELALAAKEFYANDIKIYMEQEKTEDYQESPVFNIHETEMNAPLLTRKEILESPEGIRWNRINTL